MRKIMVLTLAAAMLCVSCARKTAEERGKDAAGEKLGYAKGVGESLKTDGKDAAGSLTEGVGGVLEGFKGGLDKSMIAADIKVSEELAALGVQATRAQRLTGEDDPGRGLSVYVITDKGFDGSLRLKAFDAEDREIGRSSTKLQSDSDEASYVDFSFDERTPLGVAKYFILDGK